MWINTANKQYCSNSSSVYELLANEKLLSKGKDGWK